MPPIGGYLYMVTNGKVRVIRFFSKALTGAQLNWSTREKGYYGIFFGCKTFEDLLDNRHFILKTDHMNLTYPNVTLTGKVQRWELYLLDKDFYLCHVPGKEVHQFVPDALSRLCENHMLSNESRHIVYPIHCCGSMVGHWGLQKCREFLNDPTITDRTITQFIRQCPCCQVMSRLKMSSLRRIHSLAHPTNHSRVYI